LPQSKKAATGFGDKFVGPKREGVLFIVFCVTALLLVTQLVNLQIFAADELSEQAKEQRTSETDIPARRGTIFDRNRNILATNVDATTISANPQEIEDPKATAAILASVLGGSADDYYQKLSEKTNPELIDETNPQGTVYFVYILRQADVALGQKLKDRDAELKQERKQRFADENPDADPKEEDLRTALYGIHYRQETKRLYPYGAIGMQVIGSVSVNDEGEFEGLYGLEQMYDNVLAGVDGKLETEYSLETGSPLSGQPIPGSEREEIAPIDGQDIIISLDIELQRYLETELVRVGTERETDNGSALVLDAATGEILATASLPLAKREGLSQEEVDKGATILKSICSSYEPGSIFKSLTAAAVLEEYAMGTEDTIFVPSTRDYGDYTISDARPRPDATMSFRTIIAQSSNVGMTLVKDRLSDETFSGYLEKFGVGRTTHIDLFAESSGIFHPWEYKVEKRVYIPERSTVEERESWFYWSDVQAANISFGQGVETTPLQMAGFYGAVANDGVWYHPHFLIDRPQALERPEFTNRSERLMRSDTASELESMLVSVVTDGSGYAARIEGYNIAGKTGTAQKASPEGGYLPDNYFVSFVGYFVGTESKLVCITSMDNPIGADGNAPTGPLFASIMQFAADRYKIPPAVNAEGDGQQGTGGEAGSGGSEGADS
jgi:cell division protein FtsI (penicillin-binding protein 3)